VQGKILDLTGGPVAHVDVLIDGTLATTAPDGSFTITGVTAPYDLAVSLPGAISFSSRDTVFVVQGVTLAHPNLAVVVDSTISNGTTVDGTLGRQLDSGSNEMGVLIAGGPAYSSGQETLDAATTTGGTFPQLSVNWGGGASRQTTLFALSVTVDSNTNLPITYTGYSVAPLTLDNGTPKLGVDSTLASTNLSTVAVSGTVTPPSGYVLSNASTLTTLQVGQSTVLRFASGGTGAALVYGPDVTSVNVPQDASGTFDYALVARAEPGTATNDDVYTVAVASATPSGPNALTLPTPPGPITPADGATGVGPGTDLSWESLAGSIYAVTLSPTSGSTSDPEIILVTAATHATLPDVSELGVQLPSGTQYDYGVASIGPMTSVDAYVTNSLIVLDDQLVLTNIFPDLTSSSGPIMLAWPVVDERFTHSAAFTLTTQ